MYIELFMSQIRNEYCIETKAKLVILFPSRKDSFFPPPQFPHRLENGLFYFNKALGKNANQPQMWPLSTGTKETNPVPMRNTQCAQQMREIENCSCVESLKLGHSTIPVKFLINQWPSSYIAQYQFLFL